MSPRWIVAFINIMPNTLSFSARTQEDPFPTHAQIYELAKATNLTETQVVNWTTNVRKRNLKGTVELGKKPHHFLDYLFLATEREKQMRTAHPEMNMSLYKGNGVTQNHQGNREEHSMNRTDPPGRSTIAHPTSRAPTVFHPTNHRYEQPGIHRRHGIAIPNGEKNSRQIFRRGKQLSDLSEGGPGHVKENFPSYALARNERAKEAEHSLLRGYAPNGVDRFEKFPVNDVGHYMFDEFDEVNRPKTVSFESMCDEPLPFENGVPFDENIESYLGILFDDD
jgi:hypothetical protein